MTVKAECLVNVISDRRGCEGVCDVNEDENLNSLSLLWQPLQPATISVKVNCLSSEFAAKKHGKSCLLRTHTHTHSLSLLAGVRWREGHSTAVMYDFILW